MAGGAGGREAESAGTNCIGCDFSHLGDVGLIGVFQPYSAVAHDEHANGRMREQGTEVDVAVTAVQSVEILREGFPFPLQAFLHHGTGNVFHAFHELYQLLPVSGFARCEADAAIAHHSSGDAVP